MELRPYDDLFIDFDDTLCDTHGNAVVALAEVFSEMGLSRWFADPATFYDAYWEANIDLWDRYAKGEVDRDYLIVERFRRPLSLGEGLHVDKQLCLDMSDRFLDHCSTKAGVVDGTYELLDHLRARGYRLHLCSNGFHEVQYRKLKACRLEDYFASVILSEDAGANKPAREFFDYAFRVSGATPDRTLMIGDGWGSDILGAIVSGIDAMYFNRFPEHPAPVPVKYEVHTLHEIMTIL